MQTAPTKLIDGRVVEAARMNRSFFFDQDGTTHTGLAGDWVIVENGKRQIVEDAQVASPETKPVSPLAELRAQMGNDIEFMADCAAFKPEQVAQILITQARARGYDPNVFVLGQIRGMALVFSKLATDERIRIREALGLIERVK